jgi:SAM-dependent methyltransferase
LAAKDIAERAGLGDGAEFVCAEVYDAREALGHATFDIVYVSLGALCWLPSVDRWAEQAAGLVAPGGRLYLHDGHPLAWALADDSVTVQHSYFEETEPCVDDVDHSYTDGDVPIEHPRTYEWNHSIGEIVTALIRYDLRLDRMATVPLVDTELRRPLDHAARHGSRAVDVQSPRKPPKTRSPLTRIREG